MLRPDDAQLVRDCLGGDTGAYAELVSRYQKPLYNTALRMTGDRDDAEDITQTVFIKAYERLESYRPEFKFFSWIYRTLINEAINTLKQRKQDVSLEGELEGYGRTPDEEYEAGRLSDAITAALRELSFEYRLVIALRHFNDFSYEEMSEILSIPVKTVKSRLYTARQNLAVILQRQGVVLP